MTRFQHVRERIKYIKNWWRVVPPLNRFNSKDIIIHLRSGARIRLRDLFGRDFSVLMQLVSEFESQLDTFHTLDNPKTIVDVGANFGIFTVLIARIFPLAKVYAVEPHPDNFELLKHNIALNDLNNVTPIRAAVTDHEGTVSLLVDRDAASHTIALDLPTKIASIPVEAITLGRFQHIDLLKLDIEGAEYDVLRQPPNASVMILEIHDRPNCNKQVLLDELGKNFSVRATAQSNTYQDNIYLCKHL